MNKRFTSYTVEFGASVVVRFEPAGRESAWMIGNGTRCCCHDEIEGTSDHSWPAPWAESFEKKFDRLVWLKKWYDIKRDQGSVMLVYLKKKKIVIKRGKYRISLSWLGGEWSCNLQPCARFGKDAPEDATIQVLILLGENIRAVWSSEWNVKEPASHIVTVPVDEILGGWEIVHIKRASKPWTAWIGCEWDVNNTLDVQSQLEADWDWYAPESPDR
jgi:hypothetical protein